MPKVFLAVAAAVLAVSPVLAQKPIEKTPIRITADLSEAPRKLYHAEIDLPVKPGKADLITPQWIPGNHAPTGQAAQIVGILFTGGGKTLAWRRDDVNLYEFHVDVPASTRIWTRWSNRARRARWRASSGNG
jgi:hypothetical protein